MLRCCYSSRIDDWHVRRAVPLAPGIGDRTSIESENTMSTSLLGHRSIPLAHLVTNVINLFRFSDGVPLDASEIEQITKQQPSKSALERNTRESFD